MRDVAGENKVVNRFNTLSGIFLIFGLVTVAVGTQLLIFGLWTDNIATFWLLQGVWAIFHAVELSVLGRIITAGYKEMHGKTN